MNEDKRVKRTKRDLKYALINILESTDKDLEKITVSEICQLAMINKMTFYNHYHDKYDLFKELVTDIAKDTYGKLLDLEIEELIKTKPAQYFVKLLDASLDRCVKQRNILIKFTQDSSSLYNYILKDVIEKFLENMLLKLSETFKPKYPIRFISGFITAGFAEIIYTFLREENTTKDFLLTGFSKLISDIFEHNILFEYKGESQC